MRFGRRRLPSAGLLWVALLLAACGKIGLSSPLPDGGLADEDGGAPGLDGGTPNLDGGAPGLDGGASCSLRFTWRPLRVGAGGFLTGLDISRDGTTKVVRTDTYGGYILESDSWRQLVSASSMPAEDVGVDRNEGVYELRVAPSNPTRLYMAYRGFVFRSDDRGRRWQTTAFSRVYMDPNDEFRTHGEKMAVDPANPDVVLVGTPEDGLFITSDAGGSWRRVPTLPTGAADGPGITGIVFDPTGGTAAGRTGVVYAASAGKGVFRSSDAGESFVAIPGGPATIVHAVVAGDGVYYATSDAANDEGVWRLSGTTWREITPPSQYWHAVMVNPANPAHVVLGSDAGYLVESRDRGVTWGDTRWDVARESRDVPWLSWTDEAYMSNGAMVFDPLVANRVWFAQGIGAWFTTLSQAMDRTTWTSLNVGIEQLVANAIVAPPGGRPVLASWDRALFYIEDPDRYPSQHGPTRRFNMGWALDYASTDPSFLVAVVNDVRGLVDDGLDVQSSYSADRGRTWTRFPTMPLNSSSAWDTFGFGTIAASTPENWVWVPSNRRAPYYTRDAARTWSKISLPGVTDDADGWEGLHWAYFLNRHIVAADRVTPGTFYMYHTPKGLFRSTDGAAQWTLVHRGEIVPFSGFNAKIRSVPGFAGHLFFTAGHQSGEEPAGAFMRSTDSGATWTPVQDVLEVYAFGFGKEAPGASYPTIYIAGWVRREWGVWLSTDQGSSWVKMADYPLGSLDEPRTVEGDKNVFGIVYVGFAGSGYAYGTARCAP